MIIDPEKFIAGKTYHRVISLVPSLTELLYDLDLGDRVLGITKFCIHPREWYKNKPHIGGTKNVKIDLIKKLQPDLIIANKEENTKEQVESLAAFTDVYVSDINKLADALEAIRFIGRLTVAATRAAQIAEEIETKFRRLRARAEGHPSIRAAYVIWRNPTMVAGGDTFIDDMMGYCGLANSFADTRRYPAVALEEWLPSRLPQDMCELILLSTEPFPFNEKHVQELTTRFPAVRCMLVDGEIFSWYGSRLLKAAEYFDKFQEKLQFAK